MEGHTCPTSACAPVLHVFSYMFLTGTRKREHITPILVSLHWLPVHFRVHFKILLFVFKSLNGLAPPCLSERLHPYTPARCLSSADQLLPEVPRAKRKLRGDELNYGMTSHCTLDKPLHCPFLKLVLKLICTPWLLTQHETLFLFLLYCFYCFNIVLYFVLLSIYCTLFEPWLF